MSTENTSWGPRMQFTRSHSGAKNIRNTEWPLFCTPNWNRFKWYVNISSPTPGVVCSPMHRHRGKNSKGFDEVFVWCSLGINEYST